MINVRTLGKALKKYLSSDRAYELIDSFEDTKGSTWLSGGCWALAQALHSVLPGSELVAVVDDGVQHHVLVNLHGWYMDADGVSSQTVLLKRWRDTEGLRRPSVKPFRQEHAEGLVCPVGLVSALREVLQKLIEASQKVRA